MKLIDDVSGGCSEVAATTPTVLADAARYLLAKGQWFLLLPEGVTVGPFATRHAAETEVLRRQCPNPVPSPETHDERAPALRGYVVEELATLDRALLSRLLRVVPPVSKR